MTLDHFNTHKIDHQFCRQCSIEPFARGIDQKGGETFMVNVNFLDDAPRIDGSAGMGQTGKSTQKRNKLIDIGPACP